MPVYTSHLVAYRDLRLGQRLRDARQSRGLTLRQLASGGGISVARLSEIENGLYTPDLEQIGKIAALLHVAPQSFLPEDKRVPYYIAREGRVRALPPKQIRLVSHENGSRIARTLSHHYWPLAEEFTGRHLEPILGRICPADSSNGQFCYHDAEEFVIVLRGRIGFDCRTPGGTQHEELRAGDCIYFRSNLAHSLCSLETEPAQTLHVLAPGRSGFDGVTGWASIVMSESGNRSITGEFGDRLCVLRESRGWTLARLAAAVGLSERHLQRIERGERAAPVDQVLVLARAFGLPVSELVGSLAAGPPWYSVQRSADLANVPNRVRRTPVERLDAPRSKTCQPLAPGFAARHMYPYFIRLLNVDIATLNFHEHHSHEFIYVLAGELELRIQTSEYLTTEVLHPGDSCYLDSTVPHMIRGHTRSPYSATSAEVIDVFWSPLGESYLFE